MADAIFGHLISYMVKEKGGQQGPMDVPGHQNTHRGFGPMGAVHSPKKGERGE